MTAATSNGAQVWAPLAAAVIVAVLVIVAVYAVGRVAETRAQVAVGAGGLPPSRRGGLFHGYDLRWSTSKTIAALWTIALAFMIATEALIAMTGHGVVTDPATKKMYHDFGHYMGHVLDDPANRALYLIFLGGPYAAAVFAKTVVTSRVGNGTLQKTDGTPNQISDMVSNDSGAVDLFDLQYTLFNLIVLAAVIGTFWLHPADGLPDLPNFLAFLTGGAALTYSVNKGVVSNQPTLTAVHPQTARVGDRVTAYGNNLTAVTSGATLKAAVAGVDAAIASPADPPGGRRVPSAGDSITFLVPAPPSTVSWLPSERQQVSVTTPAGLVASLDDALAVVSDQPDAVRLSPSRLAVASAQEYKDLPVNIQGSFLGTPGATRADTATAQVSINGAGTVKTTSAAWIDDTQVSFLLPADTPAPSAGQTLTFQITLSRGSNSTQPLVLTVEALPAPELQSLSPNIILADPGTSLAGTPVTLNGQNLVPPQPPPGAPQNVAVTEAEPLKATVEAGGNTVGQLGPENRSPTIAKMVLLSPLAIPESGQDASVTVTLERGSLSSGSQTLTLRPRYDPAMEVGPITEPPGTSLVGQTMTLTSDVFPASVPESPGLLHIVDQTTLVARLTLPGDEVLEIPNLTVTDGTNQVTVKLPEGTPQMPPAPAPGVDWKISVSRSNHVIAVGQLHLQNP